MAQYTFGRLRAEYDRLWAAMRVVKSREAAAQARKVINSKPRYKAIEKTTGVPWFVVGCLHMRESNGNFDTYLGNGEPLNRRTRLVPKGRGPFATFEAGAYDALVTVEHLDQIKDWSAAHVAYAMETFNGFGYRHPSRNIPSPYLWGGTSVQKPGKFVRDGIYDPTVMDSQVGGMAVLRAIMDMDTSARFNASPPVIHDDVRPAEPSPQLSPRADDTESQVKPVTKSKTLWGGIGQFFTTAGAAIVAALAGVPWQVWAIVLVAGLVTLWLVLKGRIDVQKIIQHLSADDTAENA